MEIITLLKASFSPLVRTGQDPIILMGRRNWRNYITVYRNGSAVYIYIYTSDRPTFNKITPLSFPSSLQRAISVIDNESRVNYECIIIHLREEVVKKGFRHDYEIQSARLKWPIAANYRRLNHSSHPRISYLSMYIWCSTRVGFFFTNIQPGWLIKRGANELRNFCFSRRNLAKLNFPIICARHLTTCSFSKGLNSVLLHKEDAINYSKLFFVRGWKNFSEAKACPPSMISHGMLILLWTANFLQDNLQLS